MSIINIESFIAEIEADFSDFDQAGLLDEISIYKDIEKALKRFGNDIFELQETVLTVKNGKADLPSHFKSLYVAYLCEPKGIDRGSVTKKELQSVNFYVEKTQQDKTWLSNAPCIVEEKESVIVERQYLETKPVKFIYKNPILLKLGKSFQKQNCHVQCRNRFVKENVEEINVFRNTLQTNFNSGNIYIQYYGLPITENGELVIPESYNGHLDTYIEYFVKRKITERLMFKVKDNVNKSVLGNMLSYFKQEENTSLRNASTEAKMNSINPRRLRERITKLNRKEVLTFNL